MAGVSSYAAISARVRGKYADLLSPQDMIRLSEAADFSALILALKSTAYRPYLEILKDKELNPRRAIIQIKRYSAEQSLFPLEVALDLSYWRHLWAEARKLTGQDQEQGVKIIGALLDMNNLMWAIRYRVYHKLSEEELINYTLPFGYRVQD